MRTSPRLFNFFKNFDDNGGVDGVNVVKGGDVRGVIGFSDKGAPFAYNGAKLDVKLLPLITVRLMTELTGSKPPSILPKPRDQ
ncbi:hypothetical protein Tco_0149060 [Tanacetum coccineum]